MTGVWWGFPVKRTDVLFAGEVVLLGEPPTLLIGTRPVEGHAAWIAEIRGIVRDGAKAAFPDLRLPAPRMLPVA